MAKKLSVKNRKRYRDMAEAYKKGEKTRNHKVNQSRSKSDLFRKSFKMN